MKRKKYTRKSLIQQKYDSAKAVDELSKKWNPLPIRGKNIDRLNSTIEKNSNFINCAQKCMNVGKYKGIDIQRVPVTYLKWVLENIQLNVTEIGLVTKYLKLNGKT